MKYYIFINTFLPKLFVYDSLQENTNNQTSIRGYFRNFSFKRIASINGRAIADPHNFTNLKEVWPWEHEVLDASRNTGYDFIKWVK